MIRTGKFPKEARRFRGNAERGAQLLEFAFAAPILLLLVVGAWDVGSTIALKQKLTNAALQGARIASSAQWKTSTSCPSAPCVITDAENAVVLYLQNANVDASCISSATVSTSGLSPSSYYTWTCSGSTTSLDIREVATNGVVNVQVTLTYPVKWITTGFMGLGPPGSTVSTRVTMVNVGS